MIAAIGILDKIGGKIAGIMGDLMNGFGLAQSWIGKATAAANPAAMKQFEMVLNDLAGTVGRIVSPIIQTAGSLFRWVGDTIASLLPDVQGLFGGLPGLFERMKPVLDKLQTAIVQIVSAWYRMQDALAGSVGAMLEALGLMPSMEQLGNTIEFVGDAITLVCITLMRTYQELKNVVQGGSFSVNRIFDGVTNEFAKLKAEAAASRRSSFGAGVTPASYTTLEDFGRQARASAFGGSLSPQQQMVTKQEKTNELLGDLKASAQATLKTVEQTKEHSKNAIGILSVSALAVQKLYEKVR